MRIFNKLLVILAAISLVLAPGAPVYAVDAAGTDTGHLGNDQWHIQSDGDIVPQTDSSQDVGASGGELDNLYVDSLWLGGVEKTSWGSVVSPMTDAVGYVYPTDSGGVYRLYDAGYLSLGAGTAIDTYILFDTDDDDWHIGRDDTDNDFAIGVGSTLGTDERISIVDSATLTHIVIGDGVNAEDKQIIWDGNATDYYMAYDDSSDYLVFGYGGTVGANPAFAVENSTSPLLVVHNGITAVGATDIDIGEAATTDVTVTTDGGAIILDGTITLTDAEVISNATDDTVRIASNDADTILEVYTPYDTTGDATLKLSADLGDAAGEQWTITSTGATTDLVFGCDDSSSGTPITRFTISDTGVVTTVATQNFEIDDASNTTVTDVVNIQHFTSGTAGTGIGVGLTFDLENGAGTEEEHASFDIVATTATDGSEDTDIVVNLMNAGALSEVMRVDADAGLTLTSAVTLIPSLSLVNTNTDANSASLDFKKDGEGEADDDSLGLINFYGNDSANNDQIFGYLLFTSTDITTTKEAGALELSVEINDTDTNLFKMFGDAGDVATGHVEFNQDTADIDFHIDSADQADIVKIDAGSNDVMFTRNLAAANTDAAFIQILSDHTDEDQSAVSIIHDADADASNAAVTIQTTSTAFDQRTLFINHDSTAGTTTVPAVEIDSQMTTAAALIIRSPVTIAGTDVEEDEAALAVVAEGVGGAAYFSRNVATTTKALVTVNETHADGTEKAFHVTTGQDATADTPVVKFETTSTAHDQALLELKQLGTYALLVTDGGMTCSVEDITTSSADPGLGTATATTIITTVTTDDTGASADQLALADGVKGDIKIITLKADTETTGLEVIPNTFASGTKITFADVGDGCILVFDGTSWVLVANNGGTVS